MQHKFKAGRRGKPAKDMPCVECGVIWSNHDRAPADTPKTNDSSAETSTQETATLVDIAPEATLEEKQETLLKMLELEKKYNDNLCKVDEIIEKNGSWPEDGPFEKAYWARRYRMDEKAYAKFELEQENREAAKQQLYIAKRNKLVADLGLAEIPYPLGKHAYYC